MVHLVCYGTISTQINESINMRHHFWTPEKVDLKIRSSEKFPSIYLLYCICVFDCRMKTFENELHLYWIHAGFYCYHSTRNGIWQLCTMDLSLLALDVIQRWLRCSERMHHRREHSCRLAAMVLQQQLKAYTWAPPTRQRKRELTRNGIGSFLKYIFSYSDFSCTPSSSQILPTS